ncbi:MAG: hypothetical protein AAFY78_00345 [Cyanobacteria bacterium J06648_16]
MTQTETQWSSEEKQIAEKALKTAYAREIQMLMDYVRESASGLCEIQDVWQLHDFLSARRHDIDGKYDERESFLLFTLSKLLQDKLLDLTELEGLAADKRAKLSLLIRM